jgi:hypothetical protein
MNALSGLVGLVRRVAARIRKGFAHGLLALGASFEAGMPGRDPPDGDTR